MSRPTLKRKIINLINATMLSRVNGSVVVSGYPKTGTTYMSHVAANATALRYLQGSQDLALRRSVIHTHFRAVPKTALFCYRPLGQVVPSFVAHLLSYDRADIVERLATSTETRDDQAEVVMRAGKVLAGVGRLPAPDVYCDSLLDRGARIVNVPAVRDNEAMQQKLAEWFAVPLQSVLDGIAAADAHAQTRRDEGDAFYRRPSRRIATILAADGKVGGRIAEMAARIAVRVEGQAG